MLACVEAGEAVQETQISSHRLAVSLLRLMDDPPGT